MHFVWSWDQERQSPGQLSQKKRILTGIGQNCWLPSSQHLAKTNNFCTKKVRVERHTKAGIFFAFAGETKSM